MSLTPIQPEIYTFLDFTYRCCDLIKRRSDNHTFSAQIGGEVPEKNPMPYNVYIVIRDYLAAHPDSIEELVQYLEQELNHPKHEFKKVILKPSRYTKKEGFFRRQKEYAQIDVTVSW